MEISIAHDHLYYDDFMAASYTTDNLIPVVILILVIPQNPCCENTSSTDQYFERTGIFLTTADIPAATIKQQA